MHAKLKFHRYLKFIELLNILKKFKDLLEKNIYIL